MVGRGGIRVAGFSLLYGYHRLDVPFYTLPREAAHSSECGPLLKRLDTPGVKQKFNNP